MMIYEIAEMASVDVPILQGLKISRLTTDSLESFT